MSFVRRKSMTAECSFAVLFFVEFAQLGLAADMINVGRTF